MISNLNIFTSLMYRIVATAVFHPILEILSTIKRWIRPATSSESVEILRLLYHQTPSNNEYYELTQVKKNFIWTHDRFSNTEELMDPKWTLYGFDKTHAYFVRLPKPIQQYHARNAPFLHMTQVDEAQALARMTFRDFCSFAELVGKPSGPVIHLANTSRAGSTLLAQMFQIDNVLAFGEPDVFTHLTLLSHEKEISQELLDRLLISTLNIFCKNQEKSQIYVFKPQSPATYLFPDIIRLLPEVKNLFLYRENKINCLTSHLRFVRGTMPIDSYMKMRRWSPALANLYMAYGRFLEPWLKLIDAKDCVDFAYVFYIYPRTVYGKVKRLAEIPFVTYEQITTKPREVLPRLFDHLGLKFSEELLEKAIEPLRTDAQSGTIVSQEKMRSLQIGELESEKQLMRYEEIEHVLDT